MEKGKIKYALVTGGSRGIGRAVSVRLAQMGFYVLVNCVSRMVEAEETLRLIREAGSDGEILPFDVSDRAQTAKVLEAWKDAHPDDYIQVLVNNAGIRRDNILALMPAEDWDKVLGIALDGFYNVTQPLLQPMMFHKWGRIVAAKGGLIAATKALAQEVARKGITVNAVAPGFIRTDMTEGLDEAELVKAIPAHRFGTPEEVAALVGFLVSSEAGYITGEVISVNGGLYT